MAQCVERRQKFSQQTIGFGLPVATCMAIPQFKQGDRKELISVPAAIARRDVAAPQACAG
jgi:hypothetical protein